MIITGIDPGLGGAICKLLCDHGATPQIKLLKLCPFLDLNAEPSEGTWNATAISQAI